MAATEDTRTGPVALGDERTQLLGYLSYQRQTLLMKCEGLDAEGLSNRLPPSTLTLGGLLRHMSLVEDGWFSCDLHGNDQAARWAGVDWETQPDYEFDTAGDFSPEELRADLLDTIEMCNSLIADLPMDHVAVRPLRDGQRPNLRWIVLHLIEEYARHNGHADLLRQNVDGTTGE